MRMILCPLVAMLGWLTACTPAGPGFSAAAEEAAIRQVLAAQEVAWNQGDLVGFMEHYWKSDSLTFIGAEVTYGWNATLARYQRGYPDRAAMGQLSFALQSFRFLNSDACLVTGRYTLQRAQDQPTGMFTLLLQKKNNRWVIVYDHTS